MTHLLALLLTLLLPLQGLASTLKAGGEVNISTGAGSSVNLLSAKDTEYEDRKESSASLMWQSQEGHGHSSETVKLTQIESANLNIDSDRINVDIVGSADPTSPERGRNAADSSPQQAPLNQTETGSIGAAISQIIAQSKTPPTVQDIVSTAAAQPGLGYLAQLQSDPRVKWNVVNNAYTQWDYKQQGLTPEGAAIIAIAVTVATAGAAAPVVASASSAAVTAGTATATQIATVAATNAAFSALSAQAAVTLANNKGNIGKTLKELGSDENIKIIAFSALTAGATSYASPYIASATNSALGTMPITPQQFAIASGTTKAVTNATITAGARSALFGDNFGEAFTDSMRTSVANALGKSASEKIVQLANNHQIDLVEQVAAHAASGCAAGLVSTKDCSAGAVGAVAGELVARSYVQSASNQLFQRALLDGKITPEEQAAIINGLDTARQDAIDMARVSGAAAALLAGAKAEGIYAGADTAENAARYNATSIALEAGNILRAGGTATTITAEAAEALTVACAANPLVCAGVVVVATVAAGVGLAYVVVSRKGGLDAVLGNIAPASGGSAAAAGGPGLEPDQEPGDWEPRTQDKIKNIISETKNNNGDITSNYTINEDEFFNLAEEWLGKDYKEIGRSGQGVYRSADGTRQLRIDNNSLLGNHSPGESHVHLEIVNPIGRGKPITNNHIILRK